MAQGTAVAHAFASWTPTTVGADFGYYQLQRFDPATDWADVARITDETVSRFDDFEGRRGVVSSYRLRVVNRFGAASQWTDVDTAEPEPVDCSVVSFTTNEAPDLNVEYEDQAPRSYQFHEHVEWSEMIGRDVAVAFREMEDRGDELAFTLLLATTTLPLTTEQGRAAFAPMLAIARARLSYVCVLDGDGNRWFCSIRTPSGAWRAVAAAASTARSYTMPVTAREVTRTPSTPDATMTTVVMFGAEGSFGPAQDRTVVSTGQSFAIDVVEGW